MATLIEIHNLAAGAPLLQQRFYAARLRAAWDIRNESPATQNHAARLVWANEVLSSYQGSSSFYEYSTFLANPTIQANGNASTDNDILFVVISLVDDWAAQ
jgi:hypothetical protein